MYGAPLITVSLSWIVLMGMDRLALATLEGDATARGFTPLRTWPSTPRSAYPAASLKHSAMFPSACAWSWEASRPRQTRALFVTTVDLYVIVAALVLAATPIVAVDALVILGGEDFRVPTLVPALIAVGVAAQRLATFESNGYQLALRSRALGWRFGLSAAIALPLTIAAVALFGIEGAAAATCISYLINVLAIRWRNPGASACAYPLPRLTIMLAVTAAVTLLALAISNEWISYVLVLAAPLLVALLLRPTVLFGTREDRVGAS